MSSFLSKAMHLPRSLMIGRNGIGVIPAIATVVLAVTLLIAVAAPWLAR